METEAEQRKLEEQRKYNEEQLKRKMEELDKGGFTDRSFAMWYVPYDMDHISGKFSIIIMHHELV